MSSKVPLLKPRHVIIGAGISGLALGWFLKQRHGNEIDLAIAEAGMRPGGWIETQQKGGFLFELGPRSCRPEGNGVETLRLAEELALEKTLIHAPKAAYQRYLYIDKKLTPLPKNLLAMPFSSWMGTILKALWQDLCTPASSEADESIDSFIRRRLGQDAAELLFDPMVAGIYGGDMRKLSMQACFPKVWQWEKLHGSLLRGAMAKERSPNGVLSSFVRAASKKGLFTFEGGMQTLTDTLAERLKPHLQLGLPAVKLSFAEGESLVMFENGSTLIADQLYLAIPPSALRPLIAAHSNTLAALLQNMPALSLGVVNLGYSRQLLAWQGFGHLIPSKEKASILGMVWDSSAFPSQNQHLEETRLTVMLGARQFSDSTTPQKLAETALQAAAEQLKIRAQPDFISAKIAHQAIPQYTVGHYLRLKEIEAQIAALPAKLKILGNGFYGVSVNDCIAQARAAADSKW